MSTPVPRSEPPLWVVLACEDAPKVCTGRKALRLGLAKEATASAHPPMRTLLLDPHAEVPLSGRDGPLALEGGIVVVDCSWNRLARRGGYPLEDGWLGSLKHRRRLPLLLAGNPQHYGRMGELNTAEALGAALFVVRGRASAERFLGRFSFGPAFLGLNRVALTAYRSATDPQAVLRQEAERYGGPPPGTESGPRGPG